MSTSLISGDGTAWMSFHAFYHVDRDRLIRESLKPLISELREHSLLEAFFFMRYRLGGPHIRLRLLPRAGRQEAISKLVHRHLEAFFEHSPSQQSLSGEEIRGVDATLITNDGAERLEDLPPNNSFARYPFEPEVERYGGADLLPSALAFFQISSSVALMFLSHVESFSAGRRLTAAARLLLLQAAGSASDGEEFHSLVSYGARWWQRLEPLLAKADKAFERSEEVYRSLVRATLCAERNEDPSSAATLIEGGARALAAELGGLDALPRQMIQESQLHMTSNRLGLGNLDEAYLCRLLDRAISSLREQDPEGWDRIEDRMRRRAAPALGEVLMSAIESC